MSPLVNLVSGTSGAAKNNFCRSERIGGGAAMSAVVLVGLILIFALIGGHLVQLLKGPEVVGPFVIRLFVPSHTAAAFVHQLSTVAGMRSRWGFLAAAVHGDWLVTLTCSAPQFSRHDGQRIGADG